MKFGQRLDSGFRPPPELLNQDKGTSVFLVSWASIDIKFVNFGRRLVSFIFLGHLGQLPKGFGLKLGTNWSN